MRDEFARAMVALLPKRSNLAFITADVGYMALEGIAQAYGERFINVGVAEQNAVALAAGLARAGHLPWVYSTAPFVVLRAYEQIRNDVCLHKLPVKLVGNGGGYGYGIMGPTHHALEDVGAMRLLPNVRIYVPMTAADVSQVVTLMAADPAPNYLRLNTSAEIVGTIPAFAPWRRLKRGKAAVVVGMGPVVANLYQLGNRTLLDALEVWSVGRLPIEELPAELVASIRATGRLATIEEHYAAGGLGEALAHHLLAGGVAPTYFTSLHAVGYPSGRYGSQRWHQAESGLAGPPLEAQLERLVHG